MKWKKIKTIGAENVGEASEVQGSTMRSDHARGGDQKSSPPSILNECSKKNVLKECSTLSEDRYLKHLYK